MSSSSNFEECENVFQKFLTNVIWRRMMTSMIYGVRRNKRIIIDCIEDELIKVRTLEASTSMIMELYYGYNNL